VLDGWALTLSTWARWAELKPVVGDDGVAGGSGSCSRWNSDFSPDAPACAAVPVLVLVADDAPSFGSGAGVGNGMGSAFAEVSATMPSAAPTNSARPMPAMVPLPASPSVGSRPVWREDDEVWQKAA